MTNLKGTPRCVEEHPYKITIKELKRACLFRSGEMRSAYFWSGRLVCEVDLTLDRPAVYCRLLHPLGHKVAQIIRLVKRKVGRGERWFFQEGTTNIVCETMYLYERFVSRQTARLPYRSQGASKMQRLIRKAEKLQTKIVGTNERGPARGRSRVSKLGDLKEATKILRQFQQVLKFEEKRTTLR